MKKISLLLAIAALSLTSCQDFLDLKTQGGYSTDNFFNTDEQAASALNSVYNELRGEDFYGQNLFWEECAANILVAARLGDAGDYLDNYMVMDYDPQVQPGQYRDCVNAIAQMNWCIQALVAKSKTTELTYVEQRTLGEAYFLRALHHLIQAYRYGCKSQGAPFVAYEDCEETYNYQIPPQLPSVTDNFAYVVSDLDKAESLLPSILKYSDSEKGRACAESAVALRMRANTYWATWDNSRWDKVIADAELLRKYGRGLATLDEIYSEYPENYYNKEYCYGLPGIGGSNGGGSWFPICAAPFGPFGCPVNTNTNGWGEFYTSYDLYEEMMKDGEDNARMKTSIIHSGEDITIFGLTYPVADQYQDALSTGFYLHKWNRAFSHADFVNAGFDAGGDGASNHMFHLIRYAECLLYEAEAYLIKGDNAKAADCMNQIRKRSGIEPNCKGTWTELYHERRCELCFEGAPYLYNLKRWALSENVNASKLSEIKALAVKEMETVPRIAVWEKVDGVYTGKIQEVKNWTGYGAGKWEDYKICMPYSNDEIAKSYQNGAYVYKQNPGY